MKGYPYSFYIPWEKRIFSSTIGNIKPAGPWTSEHNCFSGWHVQTPSSSATGNKSDYHPLQNSSALLADLHPQTAMFHLVLQYFDDKMYTGQAYSKSKGCRQWTNCDKAEKLGASESLRQKMLRIKKAQIWTRLTETKSRMPQQQFHHRPWFWAVPSLMLYWQYILQGRKQ